MRALGLILRIGYLFRRHFLLAIRMDLVVLAALVITTLVNLRKNGNTALGTVLLILAIAWLALIYFSNREKYHLFRPEPQTQLVPPTTPLQPDAVVKLRASGPFSIRNQIIHLVNQPTQYTTPRSREHVLMTELKRSRLLLIGLSRDHEWGWWYQFIKPNRIENIRAGQIIHGWRPRLGLRIRYRMDNQDGEEETAVAILAFDDETSRNLVWEDLGRDLAPAGPSQ